MYKLEALCNEQSIQSLKIDRQLLKMADIAQALKDSNISIRLDEDFFTNFPLNNLYMFTLIENKVINDSNFLEKLVRKNLLSFII